MFQLLLVQGKISHKESSSMKPTLHSPPSYQYWIALGNFELSSLTSHQHRLGWFFYGGGVIHPFLDPLLHWFTSLLFLEPISNPIWWLKGFELTFSFFLPQIFTEHHLCARHSTWEYPKLTRNLFSKCSQGPRQMHRNLESNLNQTQEGFLKEATLWSDCPHAKICWAEAYSIKDSGQPAVGFGFLICILSQSV